MAKNYTVRQGDTLVHIAARECNNSITWQQIAADNNISNPNLIQVGQQLVLNCAESAPGGGTAANPQAGGGQSGSGRYVMGVDASYAQPNVDWAGLRTAGVRFAIVKASEGTQLTDNQFHKNWSGMRVNGILRGAYHYFRALQDARAQIDLITSVVSLEANDLPLVVDVEGTGNTSATRTQWANSLPAWLQEVENRTARKPIIYTSFGYWNGLGLSDFGHYPLWIANWRSPDSQPILPNGWNDWVFWQYSSPDDKSVPHTGIGQTFDLDFFKGSYDELLSFIQPAQ